MICEKCNTSYEGNFCPNCGHAHIATFNNDTPQIRKKGNVCSVLGIIFGAIGIIPILNLVFLIPAIILTIIGVIKSKNRKHGTTIASVIIVAISLIVSILWMAPAVNSDNKTNNTSQNSSSIDQTEETLSYKSIRNGSTITTDFVKITIDDVTTASKLSDGGTYTLTAKTGEILVYIKGKIANTSSSIYDLGSMGSNTYGTVDEKIDAELKLGDNTIEYGTLLVDDGGIYGMLSSGYISAGETVDYYIVFMVDQSKYNTYGGEITLAFVDNFSEKPAYNRKNCDYLYKIVD